MTALAKFTWAVLEIAFLFIVAAFVLALAARLTYEAALFGWSVIG